MSDLAGLERERLELESSFRVLQQASKDVRVQNDPQLQAELRKRKIAYIKRLHVLKNPVDTADPTVIAMIPSWAAKNKLTEGPIKVNLAADLTEEQIEAEIEKSDWLQKMQADYLVLKGRDLFSPSEASSWEATFFVLNMLHDPAERERFIQDTTTQWSNGNFALQHFVPPGAAVSVPFHTENYVAFLNDPTFNSQYQAYLRAIDKVAAARENYQKAIRDNLDAGMIKTKLDEFHIAEQGVMNYREFIELYQISLQEKRTTSSPDPQILSNIIRVLHRDLFNAYRMASARPDLLVDLFKAPDGAICVEARVRAIQDFQSRQIRPPTFEDLVSNIIKAYNYKIQQMYAVDLNIDNISEYTYIEDIMEFAKKYYSSEAIDKFGFNLQDLEKYLVDNLGYESMPGGATSVWEGDKVFELTDGGEIDAQLQVLDIELQLYRMQPPQLIDAITSLAGDRKAILKAVASHLNSDAKVLLAVMQDPACDHEILAIIASNNSADPNVFEALFAKAAVLTKEKTAAILLAVAKNIKVATVDLEKVIVSEHVTAKVLLAVAKNIRVTDKILQDLASNPMANPAILREIAKNIKSSLDTLCTVARRVDINIVVVRRLLGNPKIDANVLLELVKPSAVKTVLMEVVKHLKADPFVLMKAVEHPNADPKVLMEVVKHLKADPRVLMQVVEHPKADPKVLMEVVKHLQADPRVLMKVAEHPKTDSDILLAVINKAIALREDQIVIQLLEHKAANPEILGAILTNAAASAEVKAAAQKQLLTNKVAGLGEQLEFKEFKGMAAAPPPPLLPGFQRAAALLYTEGGKSHSAAAASVSKPDEKKDHFFPGKPQ